MKTFSQFIVENRLAPQAEKYIRSSLFGPVPVNIDEIQYDMIRYRDYPNSKKMQDKIIKMLLGGVDNLTPLMGRRDYETRLLKRIDNEEDKERWIDPKDHETDPYLQKDLESGKLYASHDVWTILNHVNDWYRNDPDDVYRVLMGLPNTWEAIRSLSGYADKFFAKKQEKADIAAIAGAVTVLELADGHKWVQLHDKAVLDREGKLMQHCAGSYAASVMRGRKSIFSLWDKDNMPHVTLEVQSSEHDEDDPDKLYRINQVKGKQNRPPVEKYRDHVIEFLDHFAMYWELTEFGEEDLKKLGVAVHRVPDTRRLNSMKTKQLYDIA